MNSLIRGKIREQRLVFQSFDSPHSLDGKFRTQENENELQCSLVVRTTLSGLETSRREEPFSHRK